MPLPKIASTIVAAMGIHRNLAVLDAANLVADEVNRLLDSRRMLHSGQLRESAQAIPANISEGYGKDAGADRNKSLRVARSEAEETISHLRANHVARRVEAGVYWGLHNRLVTVVKMLDSILH